MGSLEQLLEEIKKTKIDNVKSTYIFRLSLSYYLKTLFFIAIIVVNVAYKLMQKQELTNFFIILLSIICVYVLISLYILFSYKLKINGKTLVYKKNSIELNKIKELNLIVRRIGGSKLDKCLQIITDDSEYIIRLNIAKRNFFVALISKISNVEVKI